MSHIAIISSSVRRDRKSHRVALYFNNFVKTNNLATSEILDLQKYKFPIFEDTFKLLDAPSQNILDFVKKINLSDGIIIVTPEYNGGFPASLKNVIDLLYEEWQDKPVSISTVSSGIFGGNQAIISIQFVLWKIGAWVVTNMFPVQNIENNFDEQGNAIQKENTDFRAKLFLDELLTTIELGKRKKLKLE